MTEDKAFTPRTEGLSRSEHIQTAPFNAEVVDRIAECLAITPTVAPFRMPDATVWQLTVPGDGGRPQVLVTLWPSIRRVDVVAGPATVVFSDVSVVDLVPDVEVQFRRGNRDLLVVARGGKVIVRA